MKALITGASSGIGCEFAKILSEKGFETIIVARREDRLKEVKNLCGDKCRMLVSDLSKKEEVASLYEKVRDENIDILINNAGFGLYGEFSETSLMRELEMIELNICAVHILTKLFLKDFKKRNSGYILNVASSAAYLPGPYMSTYYATKAYVQRLTLAIYEELRREKSKVYIGALCPGPVDTEFNSTAGVKFKLKGISGEFAARYALCKMFKKKPVIIPGKIIKLGVLFQRFVPTKLLLKISYNIQKKKSHQ